MEYYGFPEKKKGSQEGDRTCRTEKKERKKRKGRNDISMTVLMAFGLLMVWFLLFVHMGD